MRKFLFQYLRIPTLHGHPEDISRYQCSVFPYLPAHRRPQSPFSVSSFLPYPETNNSTVHDNSQYLQSHLIQSIFHFTMCRMMFHNHRHTSCLFFFNAVCTISLASSSFIASGFSRRRLFPACSTSRACFL